MQSVSAFCGRYWCEVLTCASFALIVSIIAAPVLW
jgi:hypothetical protein